MTHFDWSDDLSVKNPTMDQQHKILIDYINTFYEAADGDSHMKCIGCYKDIVKFTEYHFKDEEALMEKAGFPGLNQHKIIHQQLVKRVLELGEALEKNEEGIKDKVKYFLKSWLSAHIRGIDMKYSEYV